MTSQPIFINGQLNEADLKSILGSFRPCALNNDCISNIEKSSAFVQKIITHKKRVYGINTGFGALYNQQIAEPDLKKLQHNILLSHACGTGHLLADDVVRLILLLKINSLARGYSGVSLNLLEALISLYNNELYPCIPAKGSVGASGDLVPLAHLALPLIGEGEVHYKGNFLSGMQGLKRCNLKPIELRPKEGLALLNGLQMSAALVLKALFVCERLFHVATLTGSLAIDVSTGSILPFDERIQKVRGHQAQIDVAAMYRRLLAGSELQKQSQPLHKIQDPYSLRCQPQIMGAIWHQLSFVKETMLAEANAVTDNPLIFADEELSLSGGNFHGEFIAMAADNLSLCIAEMGANAERRIALLMDKGLSNLPAFLTENPGVNCGFMVAHVTAAALASANKALAHPHSVDSLPTSANQEDHVSMSTNAALRLEEMIDNTASILGIELLATCQALEFKRPFKTSPLLEAVYNKVRKVVKAYHYDRYFAPDLALIKENILAGIFDEC